MKNLDVVRLVPKTAFRDEQIMLSKDAALLATAICNFTITTLGALRGHVPLSPARFDQAALELINSGIISDEPKAKQNEG